MIHHPLFDLSEFAHRSLGLCSVDPISLTGLALAGLGGAAASGLIGGGSAPTPQAPAAQAAPAQNPTGTKPKAVSNTPSFVGSSAAPEQRGFGTNTLLGQ